MVPQIEVEEARLIWRPAGDRPAPGDFEAQGASVWPTGAEAVRQAVGRKAESGNAGREPWIRVGELIYDPAQIQDLHKAEIEQDDGEEEAMAGDEAWE